VLISGRRSWASPFVVLAAFWAIYVFVLPSVLNEKGRTMAMVVVIAAFFVFLVAKVVRTAVNDAARRFPLLLLAGGMSLWAAGSATVNAAEAFSTVAFPSPGEVLFLLSYGGIAAFLLTEVPRRRRLPPLTLWLETMVICGAVACVAAVVVVTPISLSFDRGGLALLLAVLYPLIDLALATMVLGQLLLHQREATLRTGAMVLGFVLLAAADSSFVLTLGSASYTSHVSLDVLWGASFSLIVMAACMRPGGAPHRAVLERRARTLLIAGAIALGVLILSPREGVGWVLVAVAVVTLLSAGARMAVALRDAQGAAEALRLSRTDELTGLPNRRAVLSDLDAGLREDRPLGFMLLDLDGFKDINDSVGHGTGDALLVLVARRLTEAISSQMSVARLGGDEFGIIARDDDPGQPGGERALDSGPAATAPSGRRAAGSPSRHPSASPSVRRETPARPTCCAVPMSPCTRRRPVGWGALLYDLTQDGFSRDRLRRTDDLRRGIRDGQLVMWYQPQIDAATQQVTAVEGLVRWQHPTDGLLAPMTFLPDARRYGLMPELSHWVVSKVVDDARRWADDGFEFRVAMNCAPPELLGGTLLPLLYEELARADLPPRRLVVEVTEDSFMADPERARERLLELRDHGVEISIDDYGTGFSSLAYLRDLPVQELKIDRSFVATMCTDARSRVIVDTPARWPMAWACAWWQRVWRTRRPRPPWWRWTSTCSRATTCPRPCLLPMSRHGCGTGRVPSAVTRQSYPKCPTGVDTAFLAAAAAGTPACVSRKASGSGTLMPSSPIPSVTRRCASGARRRCWSSPAAR
jgi:predicted signal transduction protein with EAL and GGDEF domain